MSDNRNVMICNQTRWRKIFWPGGVYYIDFEKDITDIIIWFHENTKSRNIKIEHDEWMEGKGEYQTGNQLKKTAYKVYFKKKTDFMAFKLTWL